MTNFLIYFIITFIILSFVGIVAYKFLSTYRINIIYKKVGAYLFLVIFSILCSYEGVMEILTTSETVDWLHKFWGVCGVLAGIYFIRMLILFLRLDFPCSAANNNETKEKYQSFDVVEHKFPDKEAKATEDKKSNAGSAPAMIRPRNTSPRSKT